jgi:hypothetical protein
MEGVSEASICRGLVVTCGCLGREEGTVREHLRWGLANTRVAPAANTREQTDV